MSVKISICQKSCQQLRFVSAMVECASVKRRKKTRMKAILKDCVTTSNKIPLQVSCTISFMVW